MNRTVKALLIISCSLVVIWLIAPTLIIVPISFAGKKSLTFPPSELSLNWYVNFFTSPAWFDSLMNSLKIGSVVAVLATIIGTAAAIGIEKMRSRTGSLIRAALLTPMIIPGVVLAVGIYAVFLDTHLAGTFLGFVLAHTLLAIPFVVIAVGASLSTFDARLEIAATSLGASRLTTFRTVTFPLIAPGIFSGMLFAFVTSFDEIIVALFITSPYLKTLPVQIFSSMTRDSDPTVAAVGTMVFMITTVVTVVGLWLISRNKRMSK